MNCLKLDQMKRAFRVAVAVGAIAALSACAAKEVAYVPPPPPPPLIVLIPPRPMPPRGASANMTVPPLDIAGLYRSVNRNISPTQTLWNLRSAYNVAALNCREPQHATIVDSYREFLKVHAKALAKTNRTVDTEFRSLYGAAFVPFRETYMTEVYNHFALPPTMTDFCDAVFAISQEAQLVPSAELETFAARSLPSIEAVFDNFYRRMEKYRADLAVWEASYGVKPALAATGVYPAPVTAMPPAALGSLVVPVPIAQGTLVVPVPARPETISVTLPPAQPETILVTLPPAPAASVATPSIAFPR